MYCKGGVYSAQESTILVMFDCLRYKKQKSNWLSVLTRGYRLQEVMRQEKQKHISGQSRSQVGVGCEPERLQIKNSRTLFSVLFHKGKKRTQVLRNHWVDTTTCLIHFITENTTSGKRENVDTFFLLFLFAFFFFLNTA